MKIPAAATRALHCLSTLAEELRQPASGTRDQLLAGLAHDSGLHPTSLDRLVSDFASGYRELYLKNALSRAVAVGRWQPVGTVAVVAPGNLPVAAWQAAIEPLLAGNRVKVRASKGHTQALLNLQGALIAIDPQVGELLTVLDFDRDDAKGWRALVNSAQCLAIHGSDAAVTAVLGRAAVAGWSGRLRAQGEMRSLAVVDAETWQRQGPRLLRQLADDALLADGRGCMSLRTVVTVGFGPLQVRDFHSQLQRALLRAAQRWPAGPAGSETALRRQWSGQTLEMQQLLSNGALLVDARADGWLACSTDPRWLGDSWPGPGGRDLVLWTATDWSDLTHHLAPWRGRLSTLAVAADPKQALILQDELVISRLCRPGQMQAPRADRSADGHAPLEGMVRYLDRLH